MTLQLPSLVSAAARSPLWYLERETETESSLYASKTVIGFAWYVLQRFLPLLVRVSRGQGAIVMVQAVDKGQQFGHHLVERGGDFLPQIELG
jgi:hypothetical protein